MRARSVYTVGIHLGWNQSKLRHNTIISNNRVWGGFCFFTSRSFDLQTFLQTSAMAPFYKQSRTAWETEEALRNRVCIHITYNFYFSDMTCQKPSFLYILAGKWDMWFIERCKHKDVRSKYWLSCLLKLYKFLYFHFLFNAARHNRWKGVPSQVFNK